MNSDETKAAIDRVLEGRSAEFKAVVQDLAIKNHWDVNDPAFLIVLATGQMEALLKQYPAEIESEMGRALKQAEKRWESLLQGWAMAAAESTGAAKQFTQALSEAKQVAAAEQETIRVQAETQTELFTTVANQQISQLKAETKKLAALAVASAQAQAEKQTRETRRNYRIAYYMEAASFACLGATLMFGTGWMFGWFGRGLSDSKSTWSDIQRWNQEELQACVEAGRNTCNFQVEVPEE